MSTRVRAVVEHGGAVYAGGELSRFLARHFKPITTATLKTKEGCLALMRAMGGRVDDSVHVFREPRRIRASRSRYARICQGWTSYRRARRLPPRFQIPAGLRAQAQQAGPAPPLIGLDGNFLWENPPIWNVGEDVAPEGNNDDDDD